DLGGLGSRGQGLAVLLLELAHDVPEIDELRLIEPRKVHAHLDDVVAGLRLDFGGILRRLLGRGDVVDANLDPGVFGEALTDLGQLLVGGGGEVVPAQVRDLALLASSRRDAGGQNTGQARAGRREELSTGRRIHTPSCQSGAAGAEDDEGRGATDYRPRGAPVKKRRSISGFLAQTVQGPGVVGQDRSSGGRRRALVQTIALDEPAE